MGTIGAHGPERTLRRAAGWLRAAWLGVSIVAHITRKMAKLDAVRAATERTILLLEERRRALIAAAVTGQLDVSQMKRAA